MTLSKTQAIKIHLMQGHSLTGLQANDKFNVYDLASVIMRLRRKGLNIQGEWVVARKSRFMRYYIPQANKFRSFDDVLDNVSVK